MHVAVDICCAEPFFYHRLVNFHCKSVLETRPIPTMRLIVGFTGILAIVGLSSCSVTSVFSESKADCSTEYLQCSGNRSCSTTLDSCTACSMVDGQLECNTVTLSKDPKMCVSGSGLQCAGDIECSATSNSCTACSWVDGRKECHTTTSNSRP